MSSFGEIQTRFKSEIRSILTHADAPELDEAAFPAYALIWPVPLFEIVTASVGR